jgi:multiple sugar transport system permease protein
MQEKKRLTKVFSHIILITASLLTLSPLLWIARTSLVSKIMAYKIPPNWFAPPSLENYISIFHTQPFQSYFFNSFAISLVTALLSVVIGSLAAYGIVRRERPSGGLRLAILSGELFPRIVLILPIYGIVRSLGLLDNHFTFILSFLTFALPSAIWILIPAFESVPVEMEESALVDGANRLRSLWSVVLPTVLPGLGAALIYAFIISWNEFLFPLFLGGRNTRTLTVAIGAFVTQRGVDIGPVAAATMLSITPVILLVILARNMLVEGLTAGATKG